jgi:hypothetical protein
MTTTRPSCRLLEAPTLGWHLPAWILALPLSPIGERIRSEIAEPDVELVWAAEQLAKPWDHGPADVLSEGDARGERA